MRSCVENGITPLLEWISPFNQIVIAYEAAALVYLGSRVNLTGEYFFDEDVPFTLVPRYGNVAGNLTDYVARQRSAEGREGDIIRFADGHMLKIKNDWYVRIHKTVDKIRFDRHIVELILNEEIDDAIPMLPVVQANRVRNFEIRFWNAFGNKERYILGRFDESQMHFGNDRKAIATQYVPLLEDKGVAPFIFRMLDGHNIRDLMLDHVRKSISTNVRWDECAAWMGM